MDVDVKSIENRNLGLAIGTCLVLISIPIIACILFVVFVVMGYDTVNLNNISDDDKNKIIESLNLDIDINSIEFEKIETPKTFKDISYDLYFSVNSEDKSEIKNIKIENIDARVKELEEKDNRIRYCYTISSVTGKSIEFLEDLINKY